MSDKELFVAFWQIVVNELEGSMSYEELGELTHETQVAIFGWCGCEDDGELFSYEDCPNF